MTTKKNKKQSKENTDKAVAIIIGTIIFAVVLYLIICHPVEFAALMIFAAIGGTEARWTYWGELGKFARERSDPGVNRYLDG